MSATMFAGKKVAVLLESEYIPEEIEAYATRFGELGVEVDFLSRLWGNSSVTFLSDAVNDPSRIAQQFTVTHDLGEVSLEDYCAIIMAANYTSVRLRQFDTPPGEKPSPQLVRSAPAVQFFAAAMENKNIIKGALCHGLWILTPRPDLLNGRTVICHEVVLADIANAGATCIAAPTGVHVDDDLVTGRSKDEVNLFIDVHSAGGVEKVKRAVSSVNCKRFQRQDDSVPRCSSCGRSEQDLECARTRGIEGALLHLQKILRGALNDFGDCMAVCITADKGPQDHHVQGALEHFILWLAAFPHRISPLGVLWERMIHHSNFYGTIKN